jgi:hypothetical protein
MSETVPSSLKFDTTSLQIPPLTQFDCEHLDSPTISKNIIDCFSKHNFTYIMPSMETHQYLFSRDEFTVECSLYKNDQNGHNEINVQFRKLKNSCEDFTKIFKEIKQLNSKPVEQCAIFDASMTAMESVFSFGM